MRRVLAARRVDPEAQQGEEQAAALLVEQGVAFVEADDQPGAAQRRDDFALQIARRTLPSPSASTLGGSFIRYSTSAQNSRSKLSGSARVASEKRCRSMATAACNPFSGAARVPASCGRLSRPGVNQGNSVALPQACRLRTQDGGQGSIRPILDQQAGNLAERLTACCVGVEHVAPHSPQPLQGSRCWSGWLRSFLSRKSSGTSVALSAAKKPSQSAGLRDRMTSPVSGSCRMKTSLVSKR
ncbi:MAG: hypothetical protein AW07_01457 [Candidatus Accumulibacter sp. SK-11]|nr:MAG: hypothetical protein AW07_01457 [Candidatus Accumulibacter sp. SK-11]